MSPAVRMSSIVLGALLLVGAPLGWYLAQPPTTVGDPAAIAAPAADAMEETARDGAEGGEADDWGGDVGAEGTDEEASREVADVAGDLDDVVTTSFAVTTPAGPIVHVAQPQRVGIPSLGVDAPIVPVGLEADGTMEIPYDVDTIGWFEPSGVRPGQVGSAVVSGHVDNRSQGRGAFFHLGRLGVDDVVTITTADGTVQEWRVITRTRYAKEALPVDDLFRRDGDPRLVLITCAGDFDPAERRYSDNVVVTAVPADA